MAFQSEDRKKRGYITMRKGQIERSLGPFNEDLWQRIRIMEQKHAQMKVKTRDSEIGERAWRKEIARSRDRCLMLLNFERSKIISKNCRYIVDGYCHFWIWSYEPSFLEYMKKVYNQDESLIRILSEEKLMFKSNMYYCSGCPSYERE
jgi:hypothetical protein